MIGAERRITAVKMKTANKLLNFCPAQDKKYLQGKNQSLKHTKYNKDIEYVILYAEV